MMRCEELREAELKMEVSICGPEQGEILGEEINEKISWTMGIVWNNC